MLELLHCTLDVLVYVVEQISFFYWEVLVLLLNKVCESWGDPAQIFVLNVRLLIASHLCFEKIKTSD